MGSRIALYARASTGQQEHSVPGQLRELREHADREGLEVVAVIEEEGEKRRDLERPGLDRLRALAESGDIDEAWAWAEDRWGESPVPEILQWELEEYGATLRSLGDGGVGPGGDYYRAFKRVASKEEQRDRVKRATRGRRDKALRGEVFGGFRVRYGFRAVKGHNGKGRDVTVGYATDPEQMAVVRRVFEAVASGASLKAVRREFEEEGVPNPSGGPRWSTTTLRGIVRDDVFRPLSASEVAVALPPHVAGTLDADKHYGIHWSGRKRSRFKSRRGKARIVYETPREEWTAIAVDLTGSGLQRATVDGARRCVEGNRPTAAVGDRFWELSGGVLRCADCGRAMIAYRRARKSGSYYYYRCRPSSTVDVCSNRKSHRAEDLEARAWEIVAAGFDPEGEWLTRLHDRYEEERTRLSGGGADRTAGLLATLAKVEAKRDGHLDQQAEGLISMDRLKAKLADLDDREEALRAELSRSEDTAARLADLEASYREIIALFEERFPEGAPETFATDGDTRYHDEDGTEITIQESPEARRARYQRMGLAFHADSEGTLTAEFSLRSERTYS